MSTGTGQDAALVAAQLLISTGTALIAASQDIRGQGLGAVLMVVGAILVFLRGRAKPGKAAQDARDEAESKPPEGMPHA